jgi:hypothetical protein
VLGQPTEEIGAPGIKGRGRSNIFLSIGPVYKGLHFNSDAEALVVVVDKDHDPVHSVAHDPPGNPDPACPLCKLRGSLASARRGLRPRPSGPGLKVALGVAVPAIEAWYLCGRSSDVGEAAWATSVQAGKFAHLKNHFKQQVYGQDRVALVEAMERAKEEAKRVAHDIAKLEASFQQGFGALAADIRAWISE